MTWCRKKRYLKKRDAQTMRNLRQRTGKDRELYIYWHPQCRAWHLTKHKDGKHKTL